MHSSILDASGELFLGSDVATAITHGPRSFRSAANAVRFAMEHAAPVSLRGALLVIGGLKLGPERIRQLHREMTAPSKPAQRPRGSRRPGPGTRRPAA